MTQERLQVCYVGPSQAWVNQNYSRICSIYPDADVRGFDYSLLPRSTEWQPNIVYVHDRLPDVFHIRLLRRFAQWLDFVEERGAEIVIGDRQ